MTTRQRTTPEFKREPVRRYVMMEATPFQAVGAELSFRVT